jgi:hypothetical protein
MMFENWIGRDEEEEETSRTFETGPRYERQWRL